MSHGYSPRKRGRNEIWSVAPKKLFLGSRHPTHCVRLHLFHVHHYSSSHICLHMVFGGSGFCSIVIVHVSSPTHTQRSAFHSFQAGRMHHLSLHPRTRKNLTTQTNYTRAGSAWRAIPDIRFRGCNPTPTNANDPQPYR